MLDFVENVIEVTPQMALWCLCLYMIPLIISWKPSFSNTLSCKYQHEKPITLMLFVVIFLMAMTYWIDTDYFSYIREAVYCDTDWEYVPTVHMEYGHQMICSLVDGDWVLFRVICWGSALLLYLATVIRFNINAQLALFMLFATYISIFCYGRVSLAMAMYFFGASFYCKPSSKKYLGYALGGIFIVSSLLFHRTALIMVAVTPIYLFFTKQ